MRSSYWSFLKVLVSILVIAAISLAVIYWLVSNPQTKSNDLEISFLIYLATASLAAIAYVEFHRANQLNTNEILTFVSNRWSSPEIIQARQIIHDIFVSRYRYDKKKNPNGDFKIAIRNTSLDVYEMSKKRGTNGKDFVYILNLLDHFESISYISSTNQIDLEDIKNIYGNNMIFYYEILERYIQQRQTRISKDFVNFSKIYKVLKK